MIRDARRIIIDKLVENPMIVRKEIPFILLLLFFFLWFATFSRLIYVHNKIHLCTFISFILFLCLSSFLCFPRRTRIKFEITRRNKKIFISFAGFYFSILFTIDRNQRDYFDHVYIFDFHFLQTNCNFDYHDLFNLFVPVWSIANFCERVRFDFITNTNEGICIIDSWIYNLDNYKIITLIMEYILCTILCKWND